MHEDIEFAMANILDWKKRYDSYKDTKKFLSDVFIRAFFHDETMRKHRGESVEVDHRKVWTRALFEESCRLPWPVMHDRNKMEFAVLRVAGKFKVMNRKDLTAAIDGRRKPPIDLVLHGVGAKKATQKGSMYYYITENACLVTTGHVARRMIERADFPATKDSAPLAFLYDIASKGMPVDDDGIVLSSVFGAFLGHRRVLDKPVGTFPAGFTITLCKTYIPVEMLRDDQRMKCHEACMREVLSMPRDIALSLFESFREELGEEVFDEKFRETYERLTSSANQGTLEETNEGELT